MTDTLLRDHKLDISQPKILKIEKYVSGAHCLGDITIEPYSPVVGAKVTGLRVNAQTKVSEEVRSFLYAGLLRHGFLAFETGSVSADDYIHLVELFGKAKYNGTPHTPVAVESANVNTIDSDIKKTRMNYIWHIDQAFRPRPTRFTALFGKKVPPVGGDTLFSNATVAYDLLDPLFAAYLETLTAVHDVETQGFLTLAYQDPVELAAQKARTPTIEAPLVRVHPETGRKQIYANELYTQRILGLSRIASESILNILFDLVRSPDVQTRYQWDQGSVLIWDNRTVQHRGVGDFGAGHRVLYRAVID
jgi:taurine dioxygenase